MKITNDKPLIIFELANNHMGDVNHGMEVIRRFSALSQEYQDFLFAFKLQFRDLETFIHESKKGSTSIRYVKRFEETNLSLGDFQRLLDEIRLRDFLTIATPFDEASVQRIVDLDLDLIKIASCSFTDWPLLEAVVQTNMPIVASTAGVNSENIDKVISFLSNREKEVAIMHCVGQYPTPDAELNIGQIEYLRNRYPELTIGYSTHEHPDNIDAVKLAVAMGARIFEKHVGIETEKFDLNGYSINTDQARLWLAAASSAMKMRGVANYRAKPSPSETEGLRELQRGVFAKRDIWEGDEIGAGDVYFAFPAEPRQYRANDWSKYSTFVATTNIKQDEDISQRNTVRQDDRSLVLEAASKVHQLISESGIVVPGGVDLELSHHYGMHAFEQFGLTLITVVNRAYCKKILVSLPNQVHPEQYHKIKAETFHVLFGEVHLTLDDIESLYRPGDVVHIEPGVRHKFVSKTGAIIEEISSTHVQDDSHYTDDAITENLNRKTRLRYWMN